MFRALLFTALMALSSATWAQPGIEEFFGRAEFKAMKLSPDGEHVAFTYEENSEVKLGILSLKKKKILSSFGFGENMHVTYFDWGTNDRVIMAVTKYTGLWDNMGRPQHLYAANIDGTKRKQIFDMQQSVYTVLHMLPEDEDHILIGKRHWADPSLKAYRLNINNGKLDYLADQPKAEVVAGLLADNSGKIRLAVEYIEGETLEEDQIALHLKTDGDWKKVSFPSKRDKPRIRPVGFSSDNNVAYFTSNHDLSGEGPDALFQYSFSTDKISNIARHEFTDPNRFDEGPAGGLLSVGFSVAVPEYVYLDESRNETRLLKGLRQAFKNQDVSITSYSADGKKAIVAVESDTNPGEFYLADVETGAVSYLAETLPKLPKKNLVPMRPIEFTARDGLKIRGYLTMPEGVEKAPLIVNVHGGPFGAIDTWGYNPEAQYFASHGYATLQINYRGSGGYGEAFEKAGFRQWGWKMQDDVTDGTLWAIENGITDRETVCIYGGSYGGYATLRGIQKEPDLYKCAVGYVGVYDMPKFFKGDGSDASRGDRMDEWLAQRIADNEKDMIAISPAHNVEKIKADLFIAHGANDVRVPMVHFESLKKALDSAGMQFDYMVKPEGHGYYQMENKKELYSKMLKFFNKNIGQKPN
ncbi:alpha/beta hydrolase family protein [Permianibacter aggregans]|uniref:Prolyl oligopeptidase family protein n=1 Tax=Permianibacter aggregans TaxID=1510150 RepID=A0A4V3D7T1_9GAMM|nr:prolyl oligopeptidase family serine peptidase [Permianibacter aggregans]QGX40098.1 S9 family peptidase [Permianibacter aggregans]TDQ49087.1 prolyl oligopeptidase family protein [Permianibacter aggregans]